MPGNSLLVTATSGLDRYRRISTLGAGGMAIVVLAEDSLLDRPVALKRLTTVADPRGLSRLRREALMGASVSHQNLVSIYDVVTTNEGEVVIVMEYVRGQTLADVIKRDGKVPPPEALRILKGVAAGLDAIHRRQIVHRDVKPANILLGDDGAVKLADLGIASDPERTRITSSGAVLGTFSYMAPEQLEDAESTPAIDVYALAAVAFEMLAGRKARPEPNPMALAHAIATQPPPDLRAVHPDTPSEAAELLMRAMSRDPRKRPASASDLVGRLGAALVPEETAPARRGPRTPPPPKTPGPAAARKPAPPPRTPPAATAPPTTEAARRRKEPSRAQRAYTAPSSSSSSRRWLIPAGLLVAAAAIAAVILATGGSSPTTTHTARNAKRPNAGPGSSAARGTTTPGATSGTSASAGGATSTTAPSSSSGATQSGATTVTGAGDPVSAVKSFYTLAASHQFSKAWALADPAFQSQLGGYHSFQSGQEGDRSITFDSASVSNQSSDSATVTVRTTSNRTTGTQHCTGTVDLVRSSGSWLLHQIHINCA
ncbi:MAG TPA: serine/threonine-protein kinase [Solirubrobacteraceae bacterium]